MGKLTIAMAMDSIVMSNYQRVSQLMADGLGKHAQRKLSGSSVAVAAALRGAKDQFLTESLYAHLLCPSVAAKSSRVNDGFHGQVSAT